MTTKAPKKDTDQPLKITDSIIAQCLIKFDVCPLQKPIFYDGKKFDCLIADDGNIVVDDRINAAVWCVGMFDDVIDDALGAHMVASKCKFGTLDIEVEHDGKHTTTVKSASIMSETESQKIPADILIDYLGYQDFANSTLLLRKVKSAKHDASIITQCMADFELCPLEFPIDFKGKEYDCIKVKTTIVVADRINAVSWSKDKYQDENKDAVAAFLLSNNCELGVLDIETEKKSKMTKVTSAKMVDSVQVPPEHLTENMCYSDFINSTVIMGKK